MVPSVEQLAHTTSVSPYLKTVVREGSSGNAVRALQDALAIKPADGQVRAGHPGGGQGRSRASRHLKATGVVDAATWAEVQRVANPLLGYRTSVLKQGSSGAAVTVCREAWGSPPTASSARRPPRR